MASLNDAPRRVYRRGRGGRGGRFGGGSNSGLGDGGRGGRGDGGRGGRLKTECNMIKILLEIRTDRLALSSRDPWARTSVLALFIKTPDRSNKSKS